MEINLTKEELIEEANKHFYNDEEFFIELIDKCTTEWGTVSSTVQKLITMLKNAQAITEEELIEYFNEY